MAHDAEDKKHLATPKRLEELKRQGNTMRSRDFTGGLIFLSAIIVLIHLSGEWKTQIELNYVSALHSVDLVINKQEYLFTVIKTLAMKNFLLILPLFGVMVFAAFISPFIFGGWNFSLTSISFNFNKLNPASNLKNIYSFKNTGMELFKSVIKSGLLVIILLCYLDGNRSKLAALTRGTPQATIQTCYQMVESFIILLCLAVVVFCVLDMVLSFYKYQFQNMMTAQELRDEFKDQEGSGEMKQKMRRFQHDLLKQRIAQTVPTANVIITNPTHYAVALRYDENKDRAPKVVAKGKDLMAQQIRFLAISNAVPIYEAPLLARAVYHTSKVGGEIQPGLYMAVAMVLSYVFQLKNYQQGHGPLPTMTNEFDLPKEYIFDE